MMPSVGDVVPIRVRDIQPFGFFGEGDGFWVCVPRGEMDPKPTGHPSEVVSKDEEIEVRLVFFQPLNKTFGASMLNLPE